jgi:hypothetical protein
MALLDTAGRVELPLSHRKHSIATLSTHHSREASPETIFEFPSSSFVSFSPVYPCELKTAQLIENKRWGFRQPGTVLRPQLLCFAPEKFEKICG